MRVQLPCGLLTSRNLIVSRILGEILIKQQLPAVNVAGLRSRSEARETGPNAGRQRRGTPSAACRWFGSSSSGEVLPHPFSIGFTSGSALQIR